MLNLKAFYIHLLLLFSWDLGAHWVPAPQSHVIQLHAVAGLVHSTMAGARCHAGDQVMGQQSHMAAPH